VPHSIYPLGNGLVRIVVEGHDLRPAPPRRSRGFADARSPDSAPVKPSARDLAVADLIEPTLSPGDAAGVGGVEFAMRLRRLSTVSTRLAHSTPMARRAC